MSLKNIETAVRNRTANGKEELFVWTEGRKVDRRIKVRLTNGAVHEIGTDRSSILIATISKSAEQLSGVVYQVPKSQTEWRRSMVKVVRESLHERPAHIIYPETFEQSGLSLASFQSQQLSLFDA